MHDYLTGGFTANTSLSHYCRFVVEKKQEFRKMATEAAPMDEKAKRMRDLLSSFYAPDPSISTSGSSINASFDNINSTSFDADQYMDLMVSLRFLSEYS
jgi:hypothetical protein